MKSSVFQVFWLLLCAAVALAEPRYSMPVEVHHQSLEQLPLLSQYRLVAPWRDLRGHFVLGRALYDFSRSEKVCFPPGDLGAISGDGRWVASHRKFVEQTRVYRTSTGEPISLKSYGSRALCFDATGRLICLDQEGSVRVFRPPFREPERHFQIPLNNPSAGVNTLGVTAQNQLLFRLYAVGADRNLSIDLTSGAMEDTGWQEGDLPFSVVSNDGRFQLESWEQGYRVLWLGPKNNVVAQSESADSRGVIDALDTRFLFGHWDGERDYVDVVDMPTGRVLRLSVAHHMPWKVWFLAPDQLAIAQRVKGASLIRVISLAEKF